MRNSCFTVFLLLAIYNSALAQEGPVVETSYGPVQGSTLPVEPYGVSVNAFHGIYYAQAPTGDLRFAPPQPPTPWTEIRDATQLAPSCIQNSGGLFILTHPLWDNFSEDCLHVDVYAPTDTSNGPFAVMVWFHGGAYQTGANIQYPGHFLAAQDVVVVVANYRVGNLGFMYTGDAAAPGNAGMLDQVFALEWVQENIASFGGDPTKVTIFGQSAGAGSCGVHLMSPLSSGLFSGAILESGSDMAIWAVNLPVTEPEQYAFEVGAKLGCPTDDSAAMIECLRLVDPLELFRTDFNCSEGHFCLGMVPVVDGPDGMLPDTPANLRNSGSYNQVPEIVMHTREDGMIYAFGFLTDTPWNISNGFTRQEFEEVLAYTVDYFLPSLGGEDVRLELEEALNFMYSPWPYIDDPELNREQIGFIVTDGGFGATADTQIKAHSFNNDAFHMVFGYRSEGFLDIIPDWTGVFHAMEIPYVFGLPYLELNPAIRNDSGIFIDPIRYNDFDREYFDFISALWTNFAKTGNPTPEPVQPPSSWPSVSWDTFTMDNASTLWVDNEVAEMRVDYRQKEYTFWTEYFRCKIFGDSSHIPGMTGCESPLPSKRATPKTSSLRSRSHSTSVPMSKLYIKALETMFPDAHGGQ